MDAASRGSLPVGSSLFGSSFVPRRTWQDVAKKKELVVRYVVDKQKHEGNIGLGGVIIVFLFAILNQNREAT